MTGDRPLKEHEKRLFLTHSPDLDALSAVREAMFEGGEPTLHDVAIIEMLARLESHTNFIITHGTEIEALKSHLETIIDLVKGFQELIERRRA